MKMLRRIKGARRQIQLLGLRIFVRVYVPYYIEKIRKLMVIPYLERRKAVRQQRELNRLESEWLDQWEWESHQTMERLTLHRATEEWIPAILEFLREVAEPQLPYPVNWKKFTAVVEMVVRDHIAPMLLNERHSIEATMGLVPIDYSWTDRPFLGNVWLFGRNDSHVNRLVHSTARVAREHNVEIYLQSELHRKVWLFNTKWARR